MEGGDTSELNPGRGFVRVRVQDVDTRVAAESTFTVESRIKKKRDGLEMKRSSTLN